MKVYQCKKIESPIEFEVSVPGSKSITNRALLLAAMAEGKTVLKGALFSEDSRVFLQALKDAGYQILEEEDKNQITVWGQGSKEVVHSETITDIYVGSAGTAARFLTALFSLQGRKCRMRSSKQMEKRPMRPLLESLEALGVTFKYEGEPYAFPFQIIDYKEKKEKEISLNIDESSQFLSALMMAGVYRKESFRIRLTGKRQARSYVVITERMMKEFGVRISQVSESIYEIIAGQSYKAREYQIEPDVSAACYFYALAALTGGRGIVSYVHLDSMQGDIRFLSLLEKMGCRLEKTSRGVCLIGADRGKLSGVEVDMSDFSDQTMTLAAMAPFLNGRTIIKNVAHIRKQESNRLRAIVTELTHLGIHVVEKEDGVEIEPGEVRQANIETYEDHRMAMAFSLVGCMAEGIVIKNPDCCAKTFENYFEILDGIIQKTS